MRNKFALLLLILLVLYCSCGTTDEYKSDKSFSSSEYDPGSSYSPGSNNLIEFDDDNNNPVNEYEGNYSEVNTELMPDVKKRVDSLVEDYLSSDSVKSEDAEKRLVNMGTTITKYLMTKMDSDNRLRLLALINQIQDIGVTNSADSETNNPNNPEYPMNSLGDETNYKPDESLNDDVLQELSENSIDQAEIQKFYKLNLKKLQKAYESNDLKKAKSLAQGLLALFPQQENTVQYLKYLIEQIDDAMQSNGILLGKVSCDKDSYEFGEKINFKFLLRNVSSKTVKIVFSNDVPRAHTEYSKYYSPCIVYLTLSQWSEKSSASHQESEPYTLEGEAELAPGEVWQHVWEYDTKRTNEADSIGSVKVSADIRPMQVLVNEERISIKTIKLVPMEVRVLTAGYKELTTGENVIQNLKDALKNEEGVRIIIAASAAGKTEENKWPATEILINALKDARGEFRIAVFKSLRAIHGFDLAFDENYWREWYKENKPK